MLEVSKHHNALVAGLVYREMRENSHEELRRVVTSKTYPRRLAFAVASQPGGWYLRSGPFPLLCSGALDRVRQRNRCRELGHIY